MSWCHNNERGEHNTNYTQFFEWTIFGVELAIVLTVICYESGPFSTLCSFWIALRRGGRYWASGVHCRFTEKINLNSDSPWWDIDWGKCVFYIKCTRISRLQAFLCDGSTFDDELKPIHHIKRKHFEDRFQLTAMTKIRNQEEITKTPSRAYPLDSAVCMCSNTQGMMLLTLVGISLSFFSCEYVYKNISKFNALRLQSMTKNGFLIFRYKHDPKIFTTSRVSFVHTIYLHLSNKYAINIHTINLYMRVVVLELIVDAFGIQRVVGLYA